MVKKQKFMPAREISNLSESNFKTINNIIIARSVDLVLMLQLNLWTRIMVTNCGLHQHLETLIQLREIILKRCKNFLSFTLLIINFTWVMRMETTLFKHFKIARELLHFKIARKLLTPGSLRY